MDNQAFVVKMRKNTEGVLMKQLSEQIITKLYQILNFYLLTKTSDTFQII